MRNAPATFRHDESYEQWRQRMLEETAAFIEWGLAHPELVHRIPTHPVGSAPFPERLKTLFWSLILTDG